MAFSLLDERLSVVERSASRAPVLEVHSDRLLGLVPLSRFMGRIDASLPFHQKSLAGPVRAGLSQPAEPHY